MGSKMVQVEMEKKHPVRQMGVHDSQVENNQIRLDFVHNGYRYKPVFTVQKDVLTMNMEQQRADGEPYANYMEYFGKNQPAVTTIPPVPSPKVAPAQLTGTWKNLNLQDGIEQVMIRQVGNTSQFKISMVKVHPVKDMGTHTATLSDGKISLNFIHHGYRYIPTFALSNGILIMSMVQKNADGTDYATYEERFGRE